MQLPLSQGPQLGGRLLKDRAEEGEAEDDMPATGGQQQAQHYLLEARALCLQGQLLYPCLYRTHDNAA